MTIGLRLSAEEEDAGLDASLHGETIVTEKEAAYSAANQDVTAP